MRCGWTGDLICSDVCIRVLIGRMAEAIINSLISTRKQCPSSIFVHDINDSRLQYLKTKYGIQMCVDPNDAVDASEICILAVKPQHVEAAGSSLHTPPKGVVLSIVAGCSIEALSDTFKTKSIVRSMPNTPAMVLEGMTVWTATKNVPEALLDRVRSLLRSIGKTNRHRVKPSHTSLSLAIWS
jgi:pyrroline-5-carboxylate reductase